MVKKYIILLATILFSVIGFAQSVIMPDELWINGSGISVMPGEINLDDTVREETVTLNLHAVNVTKEENFDIIILLSLLSVLVLAASSERQQLT